MTLHSDWFGAGEDGVQARWNANCIEKMLSCSGGDLGYGSPLATMAAMITCMVARSAIRRYGLPR